MIAPLLLAVGCSGGSKGETLPSPTPTCTFNGDTVTVKCAEGGPQPTAVTFPNDPTKIAEVNIGDVQDQLGRADNRADPSKKSATFTVTVPKGSRVGSIVGCLGNGSVTLETVPDSLAYQSITCNAELDIDSLLIAEDPNPLKATTTYTIKVTADKASRWDVAVFGTTKPPGESQS